MWISLISRKTDSLSDTGTEVKYKNTLRALRLPVRSVSGGGPLREVLYSSLGVLDLAHAKVTMK